MSELDPSHSNEYKINPKAYTEELAKLEATAARPSTQIETSSSLNDILKAARSQNASDVHLAAQNPIVFRRYGKLINITDNVLDPRQLGNIITESMPSHIVEDFRKTGDAEYVYPISGYGRFRLALMKQRLGWELTARVIPDKIPTFDMSGMPASCMNLTKWAQGMVLITGPAGCGKTTALAILVELLNKNRHDHIITLEDPIEIIYEPKQCQITQREIGTHSSTQHSALRAALREDPDIIVVSELRDLASIQLAVSAAETGHLVLGTMNTVNAVQTVNRLIDSFPGEEQSIMRNMISESLRGVICQQLIPKKDGTGMAAAHEVLMVTNSVSNLIRKSDTPQLNNAIATGRSFGMISMDHSLQALVSKNVISVEDAVACANNPTIFAQLMKS